MLLLDEDHMPLGSGSCVAPTTVSEDDEQEGPCVCPANETQDPRHLCSRSEWLPPDD